MKYKAKHAKTATLHHYKKSAVLLIAMVLIITVGAGATLAYLFEQSTAVINTFQPAQVSCEVDEEFDVSTKTKSEVKIENTGNVPAYIRAAVIVTWKDTNGYVYGQAPVAGTDYTINYDLSNGWVQGSDGYFYWTFQVSASASTGELISSCAPISGKAPEGYYLSVEIVAEAIQANPTTAVTTSWSSGVSGVNDTILQINQSS